MEVLMLTADPAPEEVLPALDLLAHTVRVGPLVVSALVAANACDLVVVDARTDPAAARTVCQLIGGAALNIPVMALLAEPDLVSITPDWHLDDVLLDRTGPAELDARLRLSVGRHRHTPTAGNPALLTLGDLVIDTDTYSARLPHKPLDLTYKEFELLKYLTQHPGRICTRTQLLDHIWGSDFLGGPRTVDVHIRRLRAKLGADHEALIGTLRNVGYRAIPPGTTPHPTQAEPNSSTEPSPPREPRPAEPSTRDGYAGIR
jgi:DNA-binding response OmpR family regulator